MKSNRITLRAILLGVLASGLFAWYTVIMENMTDGRGRILTATQIPVLPFLLLMACVAIFNPVLRRLRIVRTLSRAEVMLIFIMTMVSSGISTFGLASQLVPAITGLFNRNWNTAQVRWDRHVEPFLNESWFLAEPGIQQQALRARSAEDVWLEDETVWRSARAVAAARDSVDVLEADLADGMRVERQLFIEQARRVEAEKRWSALQPAGTELETVLSDWPDRVTERRTAYEKERAALLELELSAFERVEQFRSGLPEPLRAVPGILPLGDEPLSVYGTRLRRLRAGLRMFGDLADARRALDKDHATGGMAALERAADRFVPAARKDELLARRETLTRRRDEIDPLLIQVRRDVEDLRARRRLADATEFDAMDRAIRNMEGEVEGMVKELQTISGEINRVIDPLMVLTEESVSVQEALADVALHWQAGAESAQILELIEGVEKKVEDLNISWRSFIAGDVPWSDWARPLARWSVLILAVYVMLMSFNSLIFRQWAHHEKLSYPLAELPLLLGGEEAEGQEAAPADQGRVPSIYRDGVFWIGFAISAFTMGWNILATRQIIPGINPISLRFAWRVYIENSMLSGLLPNAHHQVFFTMIGIAFLVPARISKSLWSFHLIYIGLLLVLVWLGFGADERSFPSDLTLIMNFRTGIGGGALIAFSTMTLWTCRRYLLCVAMPGVLAGLDDAERCELRVSSFLFLLSSVLVIGIVSLGMGANIWYTLFCYIVIMMVTIGMMRGVAEGGLLVFQCYFTPFHIIRSVVGMHRPWTSVSLFGPLVAFYYVFFWDLKTFIAPAMANALKMRDRLGLGRIRFHVSIWLAILVAAATAVLTHIILGYQRGANTLHWWFYGGGPQRFFGGITEMSVTNPLDTAGGRYWMLAGMVVMTALLFARRRKFGLLHPIGLVMWVHPGMWMLWFSIFLGWVFKTLVGRYGDRATYHRFRIFFIGLIAGELLMCLFGVDLNRH